MLDEFSLNQVSSDKPAYKWLYASLPIHVKEIIYDVIKVLAVRSGETLTILRLGLKVHLVLMTHLA